VFWGLYYGIILAVEASGFGKILKKAPKILQHSYALILVTIGWIFFRVTDIQEWGAFFGALAGANGWINNVTFRSLNILFYIPFLVPGILFVLPYCYKLGERIKTKGGRALLGLDIGYLLLFLITVTFILSKGFKTFMYVEF
jgi:alginate O-acetyltransferase complex protein AlgI